MNRPIELRTPWRSAVVLLVVSSIAGATAFLEEVIGAKTGKVYHLYPQECGTAKRINPENVIRFASAEEAEATGRRLCKTCETIRAKRLAAGIEDKGTGKSGTKPQQPAREDKESDCQKIAASRPADAHHLSSSEIAQFAKVKAVLPGGTLELDIGEKVRLLGVVFPAEGQPFAKEAARYTDEQTRGRTVEISVESPPPLNENRDALGRLAVYVVPQPDGRDLGAEMIFQGYAWLDREARFSRRPEYARREEEAWRAQRGVWKPLDGSAGKAEVVTGRFALQYHEPDCPHVAQLSGQVTLTINEAKLRRLTPCPLYGCKSHAK